MLTYPMTSGRDFFDEVLRLLDSVQLTAAHTAAWRPDEDVIIPPSVSDEDAEENFPERLTTLKPYLRITRQPK